VFVAIHIKTQTPPVIRRPFVRSIKAPLYTLLLPEYFHLPEIVFSSCPHSFRLTRRFNISALLLAGQVLHGCPIHLPIKPLFRGVGCHDVVRRAHVTCRCHAFLPKRRRRLPHADKRFVEVSALTSDTPPFPLPCQPPPFWFNDAF